MNNKLNRLDKVFESFLERKVRKRLSGLLLQIAAILMLTAVLASVPVQAQTYEFSGTETQLTTNLSDQFDPSISGTITAYSDRRAADADIYIYNITTGMETQITSGDGEQLLSDIDGENVVFTDFNLGNAEIVLYNITTGKTTRLTNNPANQRNPSISGNRVVYEDDRNGDWEIYLFDLSTMTETRLTNDPFYQRNPMISGSKVAWEDYRAGNSDIFLLDLDTGTLTQVSPDPSQENEPSIDGELLAFTSNRGGGNNIYYYRISTGEIVAVTTGSAPVRNPTVSGDVIAFESLATGNSDIWLYSISLNAMVQATSDSGNQYLNDLSGNHLVYTDNRNGNLDIYLFEFAFATPEILVAPLAFDFGDVEVGESKSTVVTISNIGSIALTVSAITQQAGWDTDFSIASAPALPVIIPPGTTRDVNIVFTPSSVGPATTSELAIESDDNDQSVVLVSFNGAGVPAEIPPSQQIEDILAFIDDSVAAGTLHGEGPGKSAANRLNALKNMIEASGDLIVAGDTATACSQLQDAYQKTDGQPRPPDFVAGFAASGLAGMIENLRDSLGCQ